LIIQQIVRLVKKNFIKVKKYFIRATRDKKYIKINLKKTLTKNNMYDKITKKEKRTISSKII